MPDLQVGVVTHYYDKVGAAIIQLTDNLAIGDKIKIVKESEEFTQEVTSMQIEHKKIKKAKKGEIVGLKVKEPVKRKAKVYKID